jgi:hypothetical protein
LLTKNIDREIGENFIKDREREGERGRGIGNMLVRLYEKKTRSFWLQGSTLYVLQTFLAVEKHETCS